MVAKDFQGIHFMSVYSQANSWCWLRLLVYSPKTFWHQKEWNILTCVPKLHINLHPPTIMVDTFQKITCVTCHLWHFFQNAWKQLIFGLKQENSLNIFRSMAGTILIQSIHQSIHPSTFRTAWWWSHWYGLCGQKARSELGVRWPPFFVGKLL